MAEPKFTVSHAGKQHSYHLAKALLDLGLLEGFYTSSYLTNQWLQEWVLRRQNDFLMRRFKAGLHAPFVHSHWSFELKEWLMRKVQGKSQAVQNQVYKRDTDFDTMMARKISNLDSSHFWGFQGSCRATLEAARTAGKTAICELATAHVVQAKKILTEEQHLHPEWADSIDNLYFPPVYEKRLEEEPFMADWVIAASRFTKWTLTETGIPESKIKLLPLGFELDKIPFQLKGEGFSNRPLRLLFAGTVTQRKGIAYLLEAMEKLHWPADIELHFVGGIQGNGKAFAARKGKSIHHPALGQYEMFQQYQNYDALVLPTVFEGFGLVIVEAMAAGLPVITTPHSMGPDVIVSGENGWLVPIRDTEALSQAIAQLRHQSDGSFTAMRHAARKAALNFTWQQYAINLAKVVGEF